MSDNPSYRGDQGQGRPADEQYDERYARPQEEPRAGAPEQRGTISATAPAATNRDQPDRKTPAEAGALSSEIVGEGGLEPPRPEGHWHLKPARLPFRHSPETTGGAYHG